MSREDYEANKPDELRKDVRMLSGCADHQTSADVSSVSKFKLPDPAGSGKQRAKEPCPVFAKLSY